MNAPDEIRVRAGDEQDDASPASGETSATLALHTPDEVSQRAAGDLDTKTEGGLDTRTDGGEITSPPVSRRTRRRWRTPIIVVIAIAVAAAAGVATTGVFGGSGSGSATAAASVPANTAKVQRTTLTRTATVDGNLGYGDATTVQAPVPSGPGAGAGAGIVTWVPSAGDIVKRGDTAYRIAERKVPLLYGSIPFYRTMKDGTQGPDVAILKKNLSALGYPGLTVDDTYDASTAEAVKQWQKDMGREQTGTVQPTDAVVAPGPRRVADVKAVAGAPLNGTVLTWTGTERVVSVALDVQYEDIVAKGTKATLTLPDNTTVNAEVTDVGSPTTPQSANPQGGAGGSGGAANPAGGSGSGKATLPVQLKVDDQKALGRYQAAAVKVSLKAQTRANVLAVPINALVAQRGGGYAVQVVGANGVQYKPVTVGMFADSMVEVSGPGITDGTVVVVPK